MISYGDLNYYISQMLDDETSERYLPSNRIAGINWALNRAQSAFGWQFANRKGPEEAMRDFTKIAIYQTDGFGSALLDDPLLGYTIANVLGVYVNPVPQSTASILPLPPTVSQYRSDVLYSNVGEPVHRVTLEMTPIIKTNASMRGNEVLADNPGRVTYAYYLNNGRVWVIPQSQTGQKFIAVAHIEKFPLMTDDTSTVDMPPYMTNILASWACEFLSWKQGAGPDTLNVLASKDAAQLFNFSVN